MTTKPPNTDEGRTEPEKFYTNFVCEQSGEGWKATEPESDKDLYGHGKTPPEAVIHYCELLQDGDQYE